MGWNSLDNLFGNISGPELVAVAGIFAIMISQGLNQDEIATLASFFSALGDNLGIIGSSNLPKNINWK